MQANFAKVIPKLPQSPKQKSGAKNIASTHSPKLRHTYDPKGSPSNDKFLTEKTATSNRFIKSPKSSHSKITANRSLFAYPTDNYHNQSLSKSKVLVLKKLIPLEDEDEVKSHGSEFIEQIIYKDEEYADSPSTLKLKELNEMSIRSGNKSRIQFKAHSNNEEAVREEYAYIQSPYLFGHLAAKDKPFHDNVDYINQSESENSIFSKTLFDRQVDSLPKSKFVYAKQIDNFDDLDEHFSPERTKTAHRYTYNSGVLTENYSSQIFSKGLLSSLAARNTYDRNLQNGKVEGDEPNIPQYRRTIDPNLFSKTKSKESIPNTINCCTKLGNNNGSCKDYEYEPEPERLFTKEKLKSKNFQRDYLLQSIDTIKTGYVNEEKASKTNLLKDELVESVLQKPSKVYSVLEHENKSFASRLHPQSKIINVRELGESQVSLNGLARVHRDWRKSPKREISAFQIFQQGSSRKSSGDEKPYMNNQSAVTSALTELNAHQNNSDPTGVAHFLLAVEVERLLHLMQAMFDAQSESHDEDTL